MEMAERGNRHFYKRLIEITKSEEQRGKGLKRI